MKKFFITLMCIVMVVCFMPTVAMAEGGTPADISGSRFIALADSAGNIVLDKDINLTSTAKIEANKSIVLDLNGHKITVAVESVSGSNTRHYYAIDNYGTFTLKDSVGGGSITARGIENLGKGVMTIESGKIISQDSNGGACIWNEATLFINGGLFNTLHEGTSSDTYGPGCLNNRGSAVITAGKFKSVNKRTYAIISTGDIEITPAEGKTVNVAGAHGGLGIDAGTAVVNGGTYTSTDYYGLYVSNDGVGTDPMTAAVTVNGGTFSGAYYSVWIGSDHNKPVNSTIRINDGEFQKPLNAQDNTREGAIVVAGGTFSSDVSQYVPEGTKVVETTVDDVTKYTLAPITEGENAAVAQVGDAGFTTLQAAINAAADGQTITLLNDVTVTETVGITKNLTLDLGGYKVTGDDCRVLNVMKGKLELTGTGTVTSVKKAESGSLDPDSSVIRVGDNAAVGEGASKASAELIIEKGVFIAAPDTYGVTVFGSGTEETVTVYGTINAAGTRAAISGNGSAGYGGTTINIEDGAKISSANDVAIYHPQEGTLNVKGGEISGKGGIEAKSGTINVTGMPIIKATATTTTHTPNRNGTSTSGYAIAVVDNSVYVGSTKAYIKGGTFKGEIATLNDNQEVVENNKKGTVVISGGSFDRKVNASYLAPGFVQSADGTVKVQAPTGGGGGGAAPATPQKPEIKPVTGGKVSLSADGTTATITPDAGKVVDKVLVNGKDMGAVTELKGLKTGDKIEVLFKDEVKEPSKAETDKQVKANMQKLAPKARSLKTKAGNVKVSFEGQFKDIEALGYTVKYKFYRSTKKASGYKHMLTTSKPSYTNTGGKKGTLYYYKAIALAYDKDGKLIAKTELKQCKYASRRWTK